jgi:hypothetical protein
MHSLRIAASISFFGSPNIGTRGFNTPCTPAYSSAEEIRKIF